MNNALLNEAQSFIEHCYEELGKSRQEIEERIFVIQNDIKKYGTYEHTFEELEYGAKLAWRNSNRCIGRLFWNSLHVIDKRNLNDKEEIKDALFNHIKYATNQGRIRSTITIFKQKRSENDLIKIWNHQLIRYAGYESKDGMIGDPDSIAFTKKCVELGWKGNNSHFDILPLVFQIDNGPPELATIPDDLIMEVPIQHPSYQWFKDLNLKWYAVPIISSMRLEIGGIHYTAAPFNGWYMGTEIGARNLADENRYNILPKIGLSLGLDIKRNSSLWKDRALIELNSAVLSSFKEHRVSIVDHHTAAQQFRLFEEKEHENGREATGNWTWLIPPISPATTHIFHKPYKNTIQKPNYFYQELPY